ncbi:MAG: hypothetical protein U1E66_10650 [Rhodospirillales bacterium]
MNRSLRLAAAAGAILVLAGCGLQPDPPPSFPITAFGGTGDLMSKCMAYASESYCEQQIWGGGER